MDTCCIKENYQKPTKITYLHKNIVTFIFIKYVEMVRKGLYINISKTNTILYK